MSLTLLTKVEMDDVVILPMYGALPSRDQSRIFQPAPPGCRKILFSTNIGETSLTVDGVVYVVDIGMPLSCPSVAKDALIMWDYRACEAEDLRPSYWYRFS